ncbi:hypothetical protein ACJX0J_028470, partial [Zea mays]
LLPIIAYTAHYTMATCYLQVFTIIKLKVHALKEEIWIWFSNRKPTAPTRLCARFRTEGRGQQGDGR